MAKLIVKYVKSVSGHTQDQRATVRALGFSKLQQVVEHNDTPQIRGMVFKIRHLVQVAEAR